MRRLLGCGVVALCGVLTASCGGSMSEREFRQMVQDRQVSSPATLSELPLETPFELLEVAVHALRRTPRGAEDVRLVRFVIEPGAEPDGLSVLVRFVSVDGAPSDRLLRPRVAAPHGASPAGRRWVTWSRRA